VIELAGIGRFSAVLFDNDGVLVDSMGQLDECWGLICDRHGLDREVVFGVLHGRPAMETLAEFLSGDALRAAYEGLLALEVAAAVDTRPMPGAIEIISALQVAGHAHTIATSATEELARARLTAAGIDVPPAMVCADHVRTGKPSPEPYVLAARRLGVTPESCVVVEDAPSGIRAGLAAGATVVALRTTHASDALRAADHVVDDAAALLALLAT
jgi:sugar-phosphatase